jgi:predicted amino acid racemase
MKCPRLEINTTKISENAGHIVKLCRKADVKVMGITKGVKAEAPVVKAMAEAGITVFGDSRIENLKKIAEAGIFGQRFLIRIPMLSDVSATVEWADGSLNSEFEVIAALGKEAVRQRKTHKVILMVDVGDLREGFLPCDAAETALKAGGIDGIELIGLGMNVGCYGGVLPTIENTSLLLETGRQVESAIGRKLDVYSGGSTVTLKLIEKGMLPCGINQLRIGEAVLLGYDSTGNRKIPGTHQDTMRLIAEVIELKLKPSVPTGEVGRDAFGNVPKFLDRGIRKRAIAALGRQDAPLEKLRPIIDGVEVLGGSSDHLILDVTDAQEDIKVGTEIAFGINYGAMLALMTSDYVEKVYV